MQKEIKILTDRIIGEVIEFNFDVSPQQKARMEADIMAILSNLED